MPIKHAKQSGLPADEGDPTQVEPTDWYADHTGDHDPVTVGTGLDVTGQLVELDLSEVAAGGELAGFLNAPTVDATHSGSTHAATQAAAEATASGALGTHAGAADPHTGYRLESADHSHASTGAQGGTIAHSATTGQTANDHHAQLHASSHQDGGADEIDVTGLAGAGGGGLSEDMRRVLGHLQVGAFWGDDASDGVLDGDENIGLNLQTGFVSVDVGQALISPTSLPGNTSRRERYLGFVAAVTEITSLFAVPDGTDPRIDLIVLAVTDLVTGATEVQVIEGIADPAPVSPDVPDDSVALWEVLIPANETDEANWTGTSRREFVTLGTQGIQNVLDNNNQTQDPNQPMQIMGADGETGQPGGSFAITGGGGDGGNDVGASIRAMGGVGDGTHGWLESTTGNVTFRDLSGTADPSAGGGVVAPLLSIYRRDNAGAGELWFKTGAADTDWTKITP